MIHDARLEKGLTQEQLADKCGTNKAYISKVENDIKDVRISTLQKIIEVGLGGQLNLYNFLGKTPYPIRVGFSTLFFNVLLYCFSAWITCRANKIPIRKKRILFPELSFKKGLMYCFV